jgi:hypothetical protein
MKQRYLLALALASSVATLASVTNTPTSVVVPGQYLLHNPDNSAPAPFTDKTNRFETIELCKQAGESIGKTFIYKCDQSSQLKVTMVQTATCADEKAPTLQLVKKTVDGQDYWSLPEDGLVLPPPPSPENNWATMVYVYVQNPKWPDGYPNCWVRGFAPETTWRVNPNYPNTPFMELVVPGMARGALAMGRMTVIGCRGLGGDWAHRRCLFKRNFGVTAYL